MRRILVIALLAACGGSLRLSHIDSSVQRPSNVAVYFTVDTTDGDPVPGLTAESFRIYEDDQPVSVLESKQTILNPEVSASHYTLLLVDMSGSVTESGDVPVIVDASRAFSERVVKYPEGRGVRVRRQPERAADFGLQHQRAEPRVAELVQGARSVDELERRDHREHQDPAPPDGVVVDAAHVRHARRVHRRHRSRRTA